ncbi:MAG: radical SAM protein [Candidatus Cloacimonetes bacterium]|nr:radical SAM protein [Candidatus Cloacimonadota bacterium]MDD4806651.1 radical SAM protein [Candidatus Cloacimonadota bacterium]
MKQPDKSLIYPLFIPMQGCPGTCVYCDQRKISGAGTFDLEKAEREVTAFIRRNSGTKKEVAFYGGTFTALPIDIQQASLMRISSLLDEDDSLRVSTHPLYIDADTLSRLWRYRVRVIELGIQDFCDEVLKASGRNYHAEAAFSAALAVRDAGFTLGVQLMPGLPQSSAASLQKNQQTLVKLKPDLLRLYPTVVIKGTALARLYERGDYLPLSLREAVMICADYAELCAQNSIRIIKYGLPSNLDIAEVVAGPYHPAFGELVKQELLRREIKRDPKRRQHLYPKEIQLLKAHGAGELFQ